MALQISRTLNSGITLPTAYVRISTIVHSHAETIINVSIFADMQARLDDKPAVESYSFSIPWNAAVSLTNAYAALKGLDFFAGAEDC